MMLSYPYQTDWSRKVTAKIDAGVRVFRARNRSLCSPDVEYFGRMLLCTRRVFQVRSAGSRTAPLSSDRAGIRPVLSAFFQRRPYESSDDPSLFTMRDFRACGLHDEASTGRASHHAEQSLDEGFGRRSHH